MGKGSDESPIMVLQESVAVLDLQELMNRGRTRA